MNYLKLSIIVAIIITVFICFLKPQLRKRTVIGDVNFAVVEQSDYQKQTPTLKQAQQKTKKLSQLSEQSRESAHRPNRQSRLGFPTSQIKADKVTKLTQPQQSKQKIKETNTKQVELKTQIPQKQRQLTQEELEIIAWNKWRSDLQNKVMRDTKLSAPIGTVFKFSFTVDREGTISNLKTWSQNSDYTPMAVRIIKPAILSYQGLSILNFPSESKRVITNVNGGFTVWYSAGYSSPSDYSDYERVK